MSAETQYQIEVDAVEGEWPFVNLEYDPEDGGVEFMVDNGLSNTSVALPAAAVAAVTAFLVRVQTDEPGA